MIEQRQVPAIQSSLDFDSEYTGTFNSIIFEPTRDAWVTVGTGGSIFTGVGIGTTTMYSRYSRVLDDLNGIATEWANLSLLEMVDHLFLPMKV